jgi:hypothetical protein
MRLYFFFMYDDMYVFFEVTTATASLYMKIDTKNFLASCHGPRLHLR